MFSHGPYAPGSGLNRKWLLILTNKEASKADFQSVSSEEASSGGVIGFLGDPLSHDEIYFLL